MQPTRFLSFWLVCLCLTAGLCSCGGSSGSGGDAPPAGFETFQLANLVIGQGLFSAGTENAGRGTGDPGDIAGDGMVSPVGNAAIINSLLYIPDSGNNRILGFDTLPNLNGTAADFALGQNDLASGSTGSGSGQLTAPQTVKATASQLFVTDTDNNRLLIWNSLPAESGAAADLVVGQAGFGFNLPGVAANRLTAPASCFVVDNRLIIADRGNHRVLIWNNIPAADGVDADLVLGQSDFAHNAANDDNQDGAQDITPSARTLNTPSDIWSDGNRLIVADSGNNRVLIWDTFPAENFAPASTVIGQPDMSSDTAGISATELNAPLALAGDGQQLFIADRNNHRVMIWETLPDTDFAAADVVLGQSDFTHNTANDDNQDGVDDGQPSARTLKLPAGIELVGKLLLVSDTGNHRALLFQGL